MLMTISSGLLTHSELQRVVVRASAEVWMQQQARVVVVLQQALGQEALLVIEMRQVRAQVVVEQGGWQALMGLHQDRRAVGACPW